MKRGNAFCLAALALACGGAVLVVQFHLTTPDVTKANFNRIDVGMARADVHELLGRPYLGVEFLSNTNEDVVESDTENWRAGKSIRMWINFVDDRVVQKTWDSEESFLDAVRRWLHLD